MFRSTFSIAAAAQKHVSANDEDSSDNEGCSPLYAAALEGDVNEVKILLEAKADVNDASGTEDRKTAVAAAVLSRSVECARLLVEAGADVDQTDVYGLSAVSWASKGDEYVSEEMAKLVLYSSARAKAARAEAAAFRAESKSHSHWLKVRPRENGKEHKILCMASPDTTARVKEVAAVLGFEVVSVTTTSQAIKQIRDMSVSWVLATCCY